MHSITLKGLSDDIAELQALHGITPTPRAIAFYVHDILSVEDNAVTFLSPGALTITEVRASVDTAPTGASLVLDIKKNGTTLYTTTANRPTIAAGATSVTAVDPDITGIAAGDRITLAIAQVGSTVAGANLSVSVICTA